MADPATFGNDRLGHLLADNLLTVPKFQRRYSWEETNVLDYVEDIESARAKGDSYFMGTIVLANGEGADASKLIVDGQQRIITTALLFIALRDLLRRYGKDDAARSVESNHLSDYVLEQEATVERILVGPSDLDTYRALLAEGDTSKDRSLLAAAYRTLAAHAESIAPTTDDYRALIDLATFLDKSVQVLVAVASGLAEAYVIFETLNDRGASLTTADLLKNYLFSRAGASITAAENSWTRITAAFDNPDDLVKFLRYEHMSRAGQVTRRGLYKAIQGDITPGAVGVSRYLAQLERALQTYLAMRDPDSIKWSSQPTEIRDSILAFRRFGFESSMPLMLAAFEKWKPVNAARFVQTVASWSIRSWFAGTLGGGQSEGAFARAAVAISAGEAKSSLDVLPYVTDIIPSDPVFTQSVLNYGNQQTTRAKYLLGTLERQYLQDRGENTEALPDWSSKSVTIEHILARSLKLKDFANDQAAFDAFQVLRERLANFTLLERTLNNDLEDKSFGEKKDTYAESRFALTRNLGASTNTVFNFERAAKREQELAELAVRAWPK